MTERDSLGRAVELLGEADRLLDGVAMDLEESGLRAVAIIGVEHELAESTRRLLEVRPKLGAMVVPIRVLPRSVQKCTVRVSLRRRRRRGSNQNGRHGMRTRTIDRFDR